MHLAEVFEESRPTPVYQRLAARAAELGLEGRTDHSIALELGVTDKTVAKAIRWFLGRVGSSA